MPVRPTSERYSAIVYQILTATSILGPTPARELGKALRAYSRRWTGIDGVSIQKVVGQTGGANRRRNDGLNLEPEERRESEA